ncbi:MAG: hypothetical protein NTW32_25455 [Chloroflexi bacterium]|nr:hypothetical protein [Chloroflexota bacterium]
MKKIGTLVKRWLFGMPIAAIIFASLMPLQARTQQVLVLFTLIWFNVFLLYDVLGK